MSCKDTLYSGQGVRPVSSCVRAPKFDAVTSVRTSFLHFTWLICSTHQSNELGSRFSGVYIYYFVDHSSKTNKLITYLAMTYHSPYLSQSDTSLQQYLNNVLHHLQCWYCVQLLGYSLEYAVRSEVLNVHVLRNVPQIFLEEVRNWQTTINNGRCKRPPQTGHVARNGTFDVCSLRCLHQDACW